MNCLLTLDRLDQVVEKPKRRESFKNTIQSE